MKTVIKDFDEFVVNFGTAFYVLNKPEGEQRVSNQMIIIAWDLDTLFWTIDAQFDPYSVKIKPLASQNGAYLSFNGTPSLAVDSDDFDNFSERDIDGEFNITDKFDDDIWLQFEHENNGFELVVTEPWE